MNVPHAHESFILADGERKITYERDNKVPNAYTFILMKEDHTLGNLIKNGYRMPHPMEYRMELRVQTDSPSYSPIEALETAIKDLINETQFLQTRFQQQVELKRAEEDDMHGYV